MKVAQQDVVQLLLDLEKRIQFYKSECGLYDKNIFYENYLAYTACSLSAAISSLRYLLKFVKNTLSRNYLERIEKVFLFDPIWYYRNALDSYVYQTLDIFG